MAKVISVGRVPGRARWRRFESCLLPHFKYKNKIMKRKKHPSSKPLRILKQKDIRSHKHEIAEQQNWICPLCGSDMLCSPDKKWHVDHDHRTGMVRGALCAGCNRAEGKIKNIISRFLSKINIDFEDYISNLVKYWDDHEQNPSYVQHPAHKTFHDKRIKSLRKAKERRIAKKQEKQAQAQKNKKPKK